MTKLMLKSMENSRSILMIDFPETMIDVGVNKLTSQTVRTIARVGNSIF